MMQIDYCCDFVIKSKRQSSPETCYPRQMLLSKGTLALSDHMLTRQTMCVVWWPQPTPSDDRVNRSPQGRVSRSGEGRYRGCYRVLRDHPTRSRGSRVGTCVCVHLQSQVHSGEIRSRRSQQRFAQDRQAGLIKLNLTLRQSLSEVGEGRPSYFNVVIICVVSLTRVETLLFRVLYLEQPHVNPSNAHVGILS